jgi:hypothetical protein
MTSRCAVYCMYPFMLTGCGVILPGSDALDRREKDAMEGGKVQKEKGSVTRADERTTCRSSGVSRVRRTNTLLLLSMSLTLTTILRLRGI